MQPRPYYGFDSPIVVWLFFAFGLGAVIVTLFTLFIPYGFFHWFLFIEGIIGSIICFGIVFWMLYGSLIAKPLLIKQMVDWLKLEGDEMVLDVGSGRGQMLVEVAKRLPRGRACGIDHWYRLDQSRDSMYQTLQNVDSEKVQDRVEVIQTDMTEIPYPNNTFDAVVSCLALHKVRNVKERDKLLAEILRVLKPGGEFIILDLGNNRHIHRFFNKTPASDAIVSSLKFRCFPPVSIVKGEKKSVIEV